MEDMIPIDWSPENLEIGDAVGILVTPQGVMQLSLGMQTSFSDTSDMSERVTDRAFLDAFGDPASNAFSTVNGSEW